MAAELGPKGIRVPRHLAGPAGDACRLWHPEFDELLDKAKAKAPARSLVSIEDVGAATAFLAHDAARLITGERSMSMAGTKSSKHPVRSGVMHDWDVEARMAHLSH